MRSQVFAIGAFVLASWGCGSGGSSSSMTASMPTPSISGPAVTVNIMGQRNDQSFSPNPAPIPQGTLVVWQNADNVVHRIVMNDGSFDSGNIGPGATSAGMRLTSSGGGYHCAIHPTTMFGSINTATELGPGAPSGPY